MLYYKATGRKQIKNIATDSGIPPVSATASANGSEAQAGSGSGEA